MKAPRQTIVAVIGCFMAAGAVAQISPNTQYYLQNVNSGLAVNVSGGSTSNGAAIIQWPYGGSANSIWTFVATSNGYYQIVSANSSKDIVVQSASTTAGANIIQWSFGSGRNDQWKPTQNSDGSYTFYNLKSGLVLEVPGNSTAQGAQLDQWGHNGGGNQEFTVNTVSGGGGGCSPTPIVPYVQVNGGTWQQTDKVTISSGTSVNFGPQPITGGSWSWSGPNGFSSTARQVTVNNITSSGDYVATYVNSCGTSSSDTFVVTVGTTGNYTAAQVLSGVQKKMTSADQVNTAPHINTMTRAMNVNVYQVGSGVFAYTSSMAIDDDGIDPDPDPDHQSQTTWTDNSGNYLGAHHVAYYVLGDDCWDNEPAQGGNFHPCPHFYYADHNITGLQFALIFYNGKVEGAVFGDTQGTDVTSTSNNDSRELGEASVMAASQLGIPSSGTTGGVTGGVTVVIFSGSSWVVKGADSTTLNNNAQAMIQKALNTLGPQVQ